MRVVGVTGGHGFIGTHVCRLLRFSGYEVVVFDRRAHDDDVFLGDVRDANAVTDFAAHVDGIVHLAAVLGTQETVGNPRPAAETNVLGTLNVAAAAHQYGLPLVNICVGNYWMRNTYSTTKRCAERLVEQYATESGDWFGNVRVVNAYGPEQVAAAPFGPGKVRKIMPAFICRALTRQPIEVYGDGEQVSDCVHVEDVARVLVGALEHLASSKRLERTIEVGPAEHTTVNRIAGMVAAEAENYTGVAVPVTHLPMRPGEQPGARVTADATTVRDIGLNPDDFIPLHTSIAETVEWFAATQGRAWR